MIAGTIVKARWQSINRWYEAEFIRDLLGDLVVIQRWGSNHSKQYGMQKKIVEDEAEGYHFFEKIDARRKSRKPPYWQVLQSC